MRRILENIVVHPSEPFISSTGLSENSSTEPKVSLPSINQRRNPTLKCDHVCQRCVGFPGQDGLNATRLSIFKIADRMKLAREGSVEPHGGI